jgi:hypothetical protein
MKRIGRLTALVLRAWHVIRLKRGSKQLHRLRITSEKCGLKRFRKQLQIASSLKLLAKTENDIGGLTTHALRVRLSFDAIEG